MTQDASTAGNLKFSTGPEKQSFLRQIKTECFGCTKCEIGTTKYIEKDIEYRPQVFARGNVNAPIVLIGQNPGRTEVVASRPFVGDAGKFLDDMIATLGIESKYLYTTNAVKCFTPKNREPTNDEMVTCREYLKKELETIRPKLVVTLGNPAMKTMTGKVGITRLRGLIIKSSEFKCDIFPLLHPASTMHNRTKYLPMMEEDLEKLKTIIKDYV